MRANDELHVLFWVFLSFCTGTKVDTLVAFVSSLMLFWPETIMKISCFRSVTSPSDCLFFYLFHLRSTKRWCKDAPNSLPLFILQQQQTIAHGLGSEAKGLRRRERPGDIPFLSHSTRRRCRNWRHCFQLKCSEMFPVTVPFGPSLITPEHHLFLHFMQSQ